jgi:2-polyprenyl-3-methyl-5-hydroxy-6-metoxy-1,4-benzoquinol methylase
MSTLNFPIGHLDVEALVRCPACGSVDEAADVATVRDSAGIEFLTTSACRRCGLIYRRRRPRLAWFVTMWARRDGAQASAGGTPFNPEVEQTRYRRYSETARIMGRYGFGPRVLDVGCGPATGLAAFAEAGFTATGLEPDASRARFADVAGVEIVEATIQRFAGESSRRFDAVTCQHSLEHFHQPQRVLELIAGLLEPEGLAYLEVPDARQSIHDWNDALYLAHLTNFTAETLTLAGAAAGLQLVGRESPAADLPGETHLAMVFRKASPKVAAIARNDREIDDARRLYRQGLPATPESEAIRFEVAEINDISLTWKADPQRIDATVRANAAGRTLEYDPASDTFYVGGRRR